ncbi:GIY-YIG nuclease family protein [Rhodoglobus aureus]|uniref:GIY-YIG domain-containing protein n=1 Tax=Rhodoglobus aureus TaxID=191497 RepID=A0ABP4GKI7_9MICO
MPGVADFKLSITKALGDQLAEAFIALDAIPFTRAHLTDAVADRGGVYQIYLDGSLVYIGKADRQLQKRLLNHLTKFEGRLNISLEALAFTAIYVDEDMSAVAPETLLIKKHRATGEAMWNFNGFGNKDPGRERDTSSITADHFDRLYPINLQYEVPMSPGRLHLDDYLVQLKRALPFNFRYQSTGKPASSSKASPLLVDVPAGLTATRAFEIAASALPDWQLTALPGYAIFYKETREYAHAIRVY